ncbi:MAG TPA: tetratricopeptide repeat protein [Pseudobdellovibrionaceae bacterium]|nr:tetratricopeptide repeat protein [Pseudobdellovibrionaceae bacterium]
MFQSVSFLILILGFSTAFSAIPSKIKNKTSFSENALLIELTGQKLNASEKDLYAEILEAYQKQDHIGLSARVQSMQHMYPHGLLIDKAWYLLASYSFEQKDYAKALTYFDKIIKNHPNSSKVSASYFAKGITYKSMGLKEVARSVFKKLIVKYPGSPDSFRAKTELKMMM